ncbi:hypothetical protein AB0G04_02535 [Actinoplanes sp. NPDC023801]|uniref:hypothetical protein n=1 Tax=Actinoplanes sp. NPDC023801 TaxID=3154595 RepID=UPI0033E92264
MSQHNQNARPAANGTGGKQADETGSSVTRDRDPRRPSERVTAIDYARMGFDLGYAERSAVGSALLVLERAQ